jgi:regulator of RNase E activity RraA
MQILRLCSALLIVLAGSATSWSQVARGVAGRDYSHVKPLPDIEPGPPAVHMLEFPAELLIKYTPLWKGERFPDGRPKVPDELIQRLKTVGVTSEEAAWGPLRIKHGYNHQWAGKSEGVDWEILNPTKGLIGRAFTCEYMPGRKDAADVIEGEARAKGQSGHNKRMMDMLRPGDVLVCDMAGGEGGEKVIAGDQLAAGVFARTGNGFVVNGGIRDQEGIEPMGYPVYMRAAHPGTFKDLMLTGINKPIRIGETTVMPGDLVIGDREGVTFVPPHVAPDIAENAVIYSLADEWRVSKYFEGRGKFAPSALYGGTAMQGALAKECAEYVNAGLKKQGLPPITEERWRERTYSGTGCFTNASPRSVGSQQ